MSLCTPHSEQSVSLAVYYESTYWQLLTTNQDLKMNFEEQKVNSKYWVF